MTATELTTPTLAATHAELLRALVLCRILLATGADVLDAEDWLASYAAELAQGLPEAVPAELELVWTRRLDEFEAMLPHPTPMARLSRREALIVSAAGLIEDDLRFGSLFARLQSPLPFRRPCMGLLSWLLGGPDDDRELARCCQRLAQRGVLAVSNTADPRPEWVVSLPGAVWELLQTGRLSQESLPASLLLEPRATAPLIADLWLDPEARDQLDTLRELFPSSHTSALVMRGPTRSGRTTVLRAVARSFDRDVISCEFDATSVDEWKLLAALCALGDFLPVIGCRPGFDKALIVPELPGYHKPAGIVATGGGGLGGPMLAQPFTVTLGHCDRETRRALWTATGLDPEPSELDRITGSFLLTAGNIIAAARLVPALATNRRPDAEHVRTALGQLRQQRVEPLASRLSPIRGDPPVVTPAAEAELATLTMRCWHRESLAAAGTTPDTGVRALFSGPSGTGKTFAARHLAGQLALDVYRVNLAGVVNKYIGETEKNLDTMLSAAEELGFVLLLDEGDSLMARRTDVSDANDRYANLETNFLLQRLEAFTGIVIITSNAAGRIDPAFRRRIDVTVDFLPPGPEARQRIWLAHLPADHRVSPDLLADVSRRCVLSGGLIRNASVHACLLAMDADSTVGDRHLLAAVAREYVKQGTACPIGLP